MKTLALLLLLLLPLFFFFFRIIKFPNVCYRGLGLFVPLPNCRSTIYVAIQVACILRASLLLFSCFFFTLFRFAVLVNQFHIHFILAQFVGVLCGGY